MATPTVTTKNFQTIWDCESVTGAVGNKPVLESEIKKQGSNSVGFTMSTVGTNNRMAFDGTIPNGDDLSGEHVRLWTTNIVFPNIDSFANGGIQLYLSDGTNESYWTIAGNDTYNGGWFNVCVFAGSTPTGNNGSNCNVAAVTEIGLVHNFLSSPKNLVNGWVDYFRIGDGLIASGGTSGDEIDMEGIYLADVANGYGIVEKYEGKFFLSGSLDIGDSAGTGTTYFSCLSGGINFANKNVSSTLYTLTVAGNATGATHADFSGTFISYNGVQWIFDLNDANVDSVTLDGCTIQGAVDFFGSAPVSCVGTVFDACGMLEPGSATLESFVIKNGTETYALLWPSTPDITNGQFLNFAGKYAVDVPAAITGPITFTGFITDSSGTDVYWDGASSTLVINKTGGTNFSTWSSAGGTVSLENTVALTIDAPVSLVGAEVRIYDLDNSPAGSLGTELAGVESHTSATYLFSGSGGNLVWIQIMLSGYEEFGQAYTMPGADGSFTALLAADLNS